MSDTNATDTQIPISMYDTPEAFTKEQLWESVKKQSKEYTDLKAQADAMYEALKYYDHEPATSYNGELIYPANEPLKEYEQFIKEGEK